MSSFTRRNFLKFSSLASLPLFSKTSYAVDWAGTSSLESERVFLVNDGPMYSPTEYITKLQEINKKNPIERDRYNEGGTLSLLLKKFTEITGKEAAVYMPSGTLANQLAIAVLSGENVKAVVQETSHVYRDEADTAQSVFGKRLIPLGKGLHYFTLDEMKESLSYLDQSEAFKSRIGAISIENPVRRCDGKIVPIEDIKKISEYARTQGIKLHLDGARIYLASAFTGISIAEYASYFDTIYISLYKYLGAAGGAILCGDKAVIDKMPHLIKIHGGSIFSNWTNAAMALHHAEGLDIRLQKAVSQAQLLISELNKIPEVKITPYEHGSNIFQMTIGNTIDTKKLSDSLREKFNIQIGQPDNSSVIRFMVNETLLRKPNDYIVKAFSEAVKSSGR